MKFRLWDVKNNKFLLQSQFAVLGNGKVIISINKSLKDFENVDQKDFVLQRDSCNYDMHEKRIYEGDILKYYSFEEDDEVDGSHVLIIRYPDRDSLMMDDIPNDDKLSSPSLDEWGDTRERYEIIGNIFENPEYLK
jgi:hypothetical protein|tara:strand:+ start:554 stop:961 length:408 start_codon:yes stop_codon:yes gene_type:complete